MLADSKSKSRSQYHLWHMLLFAMGSNMPRRPSFIQCRRQLGSPPPDRRSYLASVGAQPGVQAGEWAAHADASHKAAWSHSLSRFN